MRNCRKCYQRTPSREEKDLTVQVELFSVVCGDKVNNSLTIYAEAKNEHAEYEVECQ